MTFSLLKFPNDLRRVRSESWDVEKSQNLRLILSIKAFWMVEKRLVFF